MVRVLLIVCLGPLLWPSQAPFPLEDLATCKTSWLDWKDDPARSDTATESFREQFQRKENDAFFLPIAKVSVLGLPVVRVFPQSVGMGVGFSVMVDAPFDRAKAAVEKSLGRRLEECRTGEGTRTCQLPLGDRKTVMLLGDPSGKLKSAVIGCFYYYEK